MTQKIPQTILNAWNATQTITDRATGQPACVNLSSIASLLIQECGRWTDQYASDFIITWHEVEKMSHSIRAAGRLLSIRNPVYGRR